MAQQVSPPTLLWLRRDLRTRDNPALAAAVKASPTLAVYILDESERNPFPLGGAQCWWLHHSLTALARDMESLGIPLILRRGDPMVILPQLAHELKANAVHCGRQYDAYGRDLEDRLAKAAIDLVTHNTTLLQEPWELATKGGTPFKVYGPFSRALFAAAQAKPLSAPKPQARPALNVQSDKLQDWQLLPTRPNWAKGFAVWQPGEATAHKALQRFAKQAHNYGTGRNLPQANPSEDYSSRLSPYLAFGELSPRQVWQAVTAGKPLDASRTTYLKELAWREFAYHTLYYNPQLPAEPMDIRYSKFPYRRDAKALAAWQRGQTGYPIVDAGLRQLWQTGWMHNRVRLIAASFLVKHLLLDWRAGLDWFRDTLVDHDLANNAMNWQWIAGCGPDAAPYFRIFNPVLQSRKFKAENYIRQFVPELAKLPDRYLHAPWLAEASAREKVGLVLGRGPGSNYPVPIVDHEAARTRALLAFQQMRAASAKPTPDPAANPAKPRAVQSAAPAAGKAKRAAGRAAS